MAKAVVLLCYGEKTQILTSKHTAQITSTLPLPKRISVLYGELRVFMAILTRPNERILGSYLRNSATDTISLGFALATSTKFSLIVRNRGGYTIITADGWF